MTYTTALLAAACGVSACAALALAQPYTVNWSTVDAGGVSRAEAPGFTFTVGATAGQHDAGPAGGAAGGPYAVTGGFWLGAPNCLVDWDGNGVVNSTDVSNFINDWFTDQSAGTFVTDFNNDGVVNSTDVSDFISSWFAGCPAI